MERKVWSVVGAAYGDEGKGLATDALASWLLHQGRSPVVVRANSGAQAGHTVQTPDGKRHVFHHIGSGSFLGAPTHLSRFMALHPTAFTRELEVLATKAPAVSITASPQAPVTTPWDMLINQIVETHRAGGRHGSCGLGFGETLERTEKGPVLLARDLGRAHATATLRAIREEWVPQRLARLGVDVVPEPFASVLSNPGVEAAFLRDVAAFLSNVELVEDSLVLDRSDAVVFEGAQGLRLDQDFGAFPHVTRSNTGLRNPVTLCAEAGITALDVLYMTRSYATRHGAGPFPGEVDVVEGVRVVDATNVPNPWQGSLRVGPVDAGALREAVAWDQADVAGRGVAVRARLGVTHLDCIDHAAVVVDGAVVRRPGVEAFASDLAACVGVPVGLEASGPSRDRVVLDAAWVA
jgi:adenylosuccinate synthase